MALISDLVSAIAEVEGIPEETVNLIARYTREAGYLSQGARGRNAPRATVTDAANLLIAVNASGCVVKDAPQVVDLYRDLICHVPHSSRRSTGIGVEYSKIDPDELRFLDRHNNATFGEILEGIIERFVGGELEMFMKGEATKYIPDEFYERVKVNVGDDPKDQAARVIDAVKSLLILGAVSFTITFHRPMPHVKIVVDRDLGTERELLAGVSFMVTAADIEAGKFNSLQGGDRRDRADIGYKTLMKIAEVMR